MDAGGWSGPPPFAPGPPLLTDDATVYFQKASESGKYQFILTSANIPGDSDSLALYVLIDTGPSGVLATDMTLRFDPTVLRYSGSSMVGSVFPITQILDGYAESGALRFASISGMPFIGTRGYMATLYFQPMKHGPAALAFENVDLYQEGISHTVLRKDISGTLVTDQVGSVEKTSFIAPSPQRLCGCLRSDRFSICVTLILVLFMTIVGLFCLVKIRYTSWRK